MSPPVLPSASLGQIGVRRGPISPACMRGFCGEAPRRWRLSCRVSLDRTDTRGARLSGGGGCPRGGGRGRRRAPAPGRGGRSDVTCAVHAVQHAGVAAPSDGHRIYGVRRPTIDLQRGVHFADEELLLDLVPDEIVCVAQGGSDACVALLPSGRTAGPARGCQSL